MANFKKMCEALISILNASDLENVSSWLGKLSHPPTRLHKIKIKNKKNHQLQHTIISETMTTFANKMVWRLFESIWGGRKKQERNWHNITHIYIHHLFLYSKMPIRLMVISVVILTPWTYEYSPLQKSTRPLYATINTVTEHVKSYISSLNCSTDL